MSVHTALWNSISKEVHCTCFLYIYESFSLVLILWEFLAPPPLCIQQTVWEIRDFFFFFHSDAVQFSGLVIFQVFISSRCWTQYYLALMLFFQRYRLGSYQHCVCLTRHFLLQRAEITYPGGNLIISPKGCSAIYSAIRTVVLSGIGTKHGRLSPFSSHALQCCKAFLGHTNSCRQRGLSCINW